MHHCGSVVGWCALLGGAAPRFVSQVGCRDDPFIVSRIVQAIFSFTGASKRNFGRTEKIKSDNTFWSITLVLPDGFRYRFVILELNHQGMIWFEPWCPENLLRTESDKTKVRRLALNFEISDFRAQSVHFRENLETQNFGELCPV